MQSDHARSRFGALFRRLVEYCPSVNRSHPDPPKYSRCILIRDHHLPNSRPPDRRLVGRLEYWWLPTASICEPLVQSRLFAMQSYASEMQMDCLWLLFIFSLATKRLLSSSEIYTIVQA